VIFGVEEYWEDRREGCDGEVGGEPDESEE